MPQKLCTIKIPLSAYKRLSGIVAQLAQLGWGAIGVTRTEVPTIGHVTEEALLLLEEKIKKGRK